MLLLILLLLLCCSCCCCSSCLLWSAVNLTLSSSLSCYGPLTMTPRRRGCTRCALLLPAAACCACPGPCPGPCVVPIYIRIPAVNALSKSLLLNEEIAQMNATVPDGSGDDDAAAAPLIVCSSCCCPPCCCSCSLRLRLLLLSVLTLPCRMALSAVPRRMHPRRAWV